MDRNDAEEDPSSDYGDSVQTSEFTSVNTRELYSYEHGRCVMFAGYTQWRKTNLTGGIKASFKVAMACPTMMPSRFARA